MAVGFAIDSEKCYGCKTCQQACAVDHQLHSGVFLRRVRRVDEGKDGGISLVSMSCNHCDDPQCLRVCPVGAYTKHEDGSVIQDNSRCIGCRSCVFACPYHAPSYDEKEGVVHKCDTCLQRREAGLDPMCVVSCPAANIAFGDTDEVKDAYEGAQSIKSQSSVRPNLYVKADKDMDLKTLEDIDGDKKTVDRGGIRY